MGETNKDQARDCLIWGIYIGSIGIINGILL